MKKEFCAKNQSGKFGAYDAKMRVDGENDFVVLSGSKVVSGILLKEDQKFPSPSAAGLFVRGGANNGWTFWKSEDGTTLNDLAIN